MSKAEQMMLSIGMGLALVSIAAAVLWVGL